MIVRVVVIHVLLLVAGFSPVPGAHAFECPELQAGSDTVDTGGYPHGLLWRVESAGGARSHVFGTIHIADARVTDFDPSVRDALAGSDSFMMEVLLDAEALRRMAGAMRFDDGRSLSAALPQDMYERATALLMRYGVTPEAANQLKPWAVYTTLSLPPDQLSAPMDLVLLNEARARGMQASGLETLDEQVAVFDSLSDDEQLEMLAMTLCNYDRFQQEVDEMIGYYVDRDLGAMMRMAARYDSPLQERFMDLLLRQRNHRMAARMLGPLERGGYFVAIGALHLPGREGVLSLIEAAGFDVTRVY